MPTARKLKSGSWTCKILDHYETIVLPDGTTKKKGIYKSFTCKDKSRAGKRTCEQMAAVYAANKEHVKDVADITLGEAIDRYTNSRESILSPRTIGEYRRIRKKHMQDIMDIKIVRLTQEDIQNCINLEAKTHAPKTIRNWHGLISTTLAVFRPEFKLRTTLPKKVRNEVKIPSETEIKRLIEFVKGTDMELPIMLCITGLFRRSEVCELRKTDIMDKYIHVSRAVVLNEDKEWVVKAPKSYAGDRFVKMPQELIDMCLLQEGDKLVSCTPDQLSNRFSRTLARAGLPHYKLHALRHYGASILHAIGVPDLYILNRAGWETDEMLKKIYRHVVAERDVEMNEKIISYFGESLNLAA